MYIYIYLIARLYLIAQAATFLEMLFLVHMVTFSIPMVVCLVHPIVNCTSSNHLGTMHTKLGKSQAQTTPDCVSAKTILAIFCDVKNAKIQGFDPQPVEESKMRLDIVFNDNMCQLTISCDFPKVC